MWHGVKVVSGRRVCVSVRRHGGNVLSDSLHLLDSSSSSSSSSLAVDDNMSAPGTPTWYVSLWDSFSRRWIIERIPPRVLTAALERGRVSLAATRPTPKPRGDANLVIADGEGAHPGGWDKGQRLAQAAASDVIDRMRVRNGMLEWHDEHEAESTLA